MQHQTWNKKRGKPWWYLDFEIHANLKVKHTTTHY